MRIDNPTIFGNLTTTGSNSDASLTGSFSGSLTGSILGEIIGTADSASVAARATTLSTDATASFADRATSASIADFATIADDAITASQALNIKSGSTASFADRATSASISDGISQLATASFADRATSSSISDGISQLATASFADRATTSSQADSATTASNIENNIVNYAKVGTEFKTTGSLSVASNTASVDFSATQIFTLTLSSNTHLEWNNYDNGMIKNIVLTGGGGSYTITVPGSSQRITGIYDDTAAAKNLIQVVCTNADSGNEEFWYSIAQSI